MPRPFPWVVAGTGPSLKPIDRTQYRILALNRAIHFFPVVDAWCFAHKLTFEACADQLWKTPIVITGHKLATDPGEVLTSTYLPLYNACAEKLKILHVHAKDLPAPPHFRNSTRETAWGTCTIACLAVCWIARQGQDVFYSVGIDGGRENHEDLKEVHKNRFAQHGRPCYDECRPALSAMLNTLGMKWTHL